MTFFLRILIRIKWGVGNKNGNKVSDSIFPYLIAPDDFDEDKVRLVC